MSTNEPSKHNQALHQILGEWEVRAPLPPGFRAKVWQRIERAEAQREATFWKAFLNWIEMTLPPRVIAVSSATLFLAAGLTAGYWHGRQATTHWDTALSVRYMQSVDPYQAPRPNAQ